MITKLLRSFKITRSFSEEYIILQNKYKIECYIENNTPGTLIGLCTGSITMDELKQFILTNSLEIDLIEYIRPNRFNPSSKELLQYLAILYAPSKDLFDRFDLSTKDEVKIENLPEVAKILTIFSEQNLEEYPELL